MIAFALLLGCLPQDSQPAAGEPLARFMALPVVQKAALVRTLEKRLQRDPDPALQRILGLQRGAEHWPEAPPPRVHDPEVWAKGVAPARSWVPAGSVEHRAMRAQYPRPRCLDDLCTAVVYDWGSARVVRTKPLSIEQVYANALAGYPPGSDEAVAQILQALDTDQKQQQVAAYFAHTYADLEAKLYEGITLYESWYSGRVCDIPDVDAIPFAVGILDDKSYVSPIPADRRRERLYMRIRDQAHAHRLYRTLREAAAAAFVRGEPILEPPYDLLVPRFHLLWQECDDEPKRLGALLAGATSRDGLLAEVDARVKRSPEVFVRREARKHELTELAARVRALALTLLE